MSIQPTSSVGRVAESRSGGRSASGGKAHGEGGNEPVANVTISGQAKLASVLSGLSDKSKAEASAFESKIKKQLASGNFNAAELIKDASPTFVHDLMQGGLDIQSAVETMKERTVAHVKPFDYRQLIQMTNQVMNSNG